MLSPWRRVEKLLAGLTGVSDGGPPGEAVALAGVCGAGAVVLAEVLLDLVARDLHRRQRVAHARLGVHVLRRRGGRYHLGVAAAGARETSSSMLQTYVPRKVVISKALLLAG